MRALRIVLTLAALAVIAGLVLRFLRGEPARRAVQGEIALEVEVEAEPARPADLRAVPDTQQVGSTAAQRTAADSPGARSEPSGSGSVAPRVAPVEARTSFVRGRLRSERGAWRDLGALLGGGVLVDLVSTFEPRIKRRANLRAEVEADGASAIDFAFEGLPIGRYVLTVSSLEPELWSPASLECEAPVEGLEIWCRDRARRVELEFHVRDRRSGETLEGWSATSIRQTVSASEGVLMHAGPLAREGFAIDGALDWSIWAPGYAPAFGSEGDFVPRDAERWVAEVELRRGWGARLLVLGRDPSMRPLAGARVLVDGADVGSTDAEGRLDLWAAERPARVEASWGGLSGSRTELAEVDSPAARSQGHVLVLVLQPDE